MVGNFMHWPICESYFLHKIELVLAVFKYSLEELIRLRYLYEKLYFVEDIFIYCIRNPSIVLEIRPLCLCKLQVFICITIIMCLCLFVMFYARSEQLFFGPQREKTCLRWFANNIGADQPAHVRSLICAFVIRFLESFICKLETGEISIF